MPIRPLSLANGSVSPPVSARELLQAGKLLDALEQVKQDVRKNPREASLRTFLFQMFCITGEWDRALTQASVAAELDPLALPMAQTYRRVIRCEMLREKVYRGESSPTVLGDPGPAVPLLIEAVRLLAGGQPEPAAQMREQAFQAATESEGTLDDVPFEWIADADPRLGPVLEVFVNGNYLWVPFAAVHAVHIETPADLRDQVWMPAHFIWSNQGEADGFVPTRYPGSASAADPALALSRRTEWCESATDWSIPIGQRVLVTDVDETALMDVRKLVMTPRAAAAA
jgi:type VI secretion system protein ImpE